MIKYHSIFNEAPDTLWEINEKKFKTISSSPLCSEIYHGILNDKGKLDNERKDKLEEDINFPLHKDLVDKISGFLAKEGCFLVTGFRGVGKSSVVNRAISKFILSKIAAQNKELQQILDEIILVPIPMEQSIDLFSLVRIIFRNIFSKLLTNTTFKENVVKLKKVKNTGALEFKEIGRDGVDKEIQNKLNDLYYGLEIYIDNIREPEIVYNRPKEFSIPIFSGGGGVVFPEGEKVYSIPKLTTAHLIYELKNFINLLSSKNFKFIFIFDELDRLKSQEEIIAEKGKTGIYLMEILVKELKVLFNQAKANFIFIAGVDMYEKWQAEKSRGDGIYEGIFSENFYVSSLLTNNRAHSYKSTTPIISEENPIINKLEKQYLETYSPLTEEMSVLNDTDTMNIIQKYLIDLLLHKEREMNVGDIGIKLQVKLIPGSLRYYCFQEIINSSEFRFNLSDMDYDVEGLTDKSIKNIKNLLNSTSEDISDLVDFKEKFIKQIEYKKNAGKTVNENLTFQSFLQKNYDKNKIFIKTSYTIMFESFCRYLSFKSRGIIRKLIREINDFIVVKDNRLFLYISCYEAQKIKFFSGVEKLIQTRMPAHYLQNDKNKILLYFIIDNTFKFYKQGFNMDVWETFSILPDREKVLIDKKIYNDAVAILRGNYIELSFGRKSLFQFTPKYSRLIDHIIKKIPHEQHNFNISSLDYNEHLMDLQKQLDDMEFKTTQGTISNLNIQSQIGKVYVQLNNPIKAENFYRNTIKLGIEEVEKIVQNPDNIPLRLHDALLILDLICECYIEIGLLEFDAQNNKKGISFLWSGVKAFLNFYEWLVNPAILTKLNQERMDNAHSETFLFTFNPFSEENRDGTLGFLDKLLDYIFYVRGNGDDDSLTKEIGKFKKLKKSFLDVLSNEKTSEKILKIQDKEEFKKLLEEHFQSILSNSNDLDDKLKNAFLSIGFEPQTTFQIKGKLGAFPGYLTVLNQKLWRRDLPEFFSPKLLYSINTLSTVYSRLGQFELSAQLLIAGLTIADNTSFHSNAIIQRLQLALFFLLRFDLIKSLQYYRAIFRYLNVQKKYGQSDYYMNNELLAGIFDMVGILQSTLISFKFLEDATDEEIKEEIHLLYSFTAQNYYLKEDNVRKTIGSKLKLVKALIYQSINEFYLAKETPSNRKQSRIPRFFFIIHKAIDICNDILTIGRKKNFSTQDAKIEFSIVRNSGETLSHLGEISLMLSRFPQLIYLTSNNPLNNLYDKLNSIWNAVSLILKDKEKYCILEDSIQDLNFSNKISLKFHILAEKFLRLGERFLTSFYMPESNNIPLRLGMTFYFFSTNIKNDPENEARIRYLEVAAIYLQKAIKGFSEYQDFEYSSEEWIIGAYSDLGNVYYDIYKFVNVNNELDRKYFLKLAIINFKESLKVFAIRMNDLFASLSGKEPRLRVSLDSLFDTDYSFYLFQKISRKMVSSKWKDLKHKCMQKKDMKRYGFFADTALIHDIGKYLKSCFYSSRWDITLDDNDEQLNIILQETKYLSNIFRNFGGTENQDEINKLYKEIISRNPEINRESNEEINPDPFQALIKELKKESQGELRTEPWPIGGYRFIVCDEDLITEEIKNFTKEYTDFRGEPFNPRIKTQRK